MSSTSFTENIVLTNPLEEQYGGTNQNSYNTGDILYASGTDALNKLPVGEDSQILTSNGITVSWQNTELDLFYGPYPENVADTTSISGLGASPPIKWTGGVLAPNGKIYGIPRNSTSVLIIDPVNNTADTTTITGLSAPFKWTGAVLAPNSKIYGIPKILIVY